MQIVIELSEKNYKSCMLTQNRPIGQRLPYGLSKAIKNGTILPKGHGKLVDVEDVKDNIEKWRGYLDEDMIGRISYAMDHHIPTIIEADEESEE